MKRMKVRYSATPGAIVCRMEFTNASSSLKGGYAIPGTADHVGRLPGPWIEGFRKACEDDHTYVIWSYETPIAWHTIDDEEGHHTWHVPNVAYPVTTTKHLTAVKRAIQREEEHASQYGFEKARRAG